MLIDIGDRIDVQRSGEAPEFVLEAGWGPAGRCACITRGWPRPPRWRSWRPAARRAHQPAGRRKVLAIHEVRSPSKDISVVAVMIAMCVPSGLVNTRPRSRS